MTRGHRERERRGEQDEEREVGEGETHRERNRHQIHCFHCLIRTTARERMEGWGEEEREKKTRSNMRRVERDSHTFLPQTEV